MAIKLWTVFAVTGMSGEPIWQIIRLSLDVMWYYAVRPQLLKYKLKAFILNVIEIHCKEVTYYFTV